MTNMNRLCYLFDHLHSYIKYEKHDYKERCSSLRERQTHSLLHRKTTKNEQHTVLLNFSKVI